MPTATRPLLALLLAAFTASATARGWSKSDDVGSDPVTKTTHEAFDFSATGTVDVRDIGGSVQVTAGKGDRVEFSYERRAATQRDFDCETLRYEHDKNELRIWVEHKDERACRNIRASDKLTLTVPRGASVAARAIGDDVNVSGVEGMLRLVAVGDSVTVTGAQQVEATSIGDSVKLDVTRVGPGGIRLQSIGDSVELNLPEDVHARMTIESVGDEIRGPGLRLRSDDDDYETVLGKGGPAIKIQSVGDSVVIRGPRLSQPERDERRGRQHNYY